MLQFPLNLGVPDCRIIVVPACEIDIEPSQSTPIMCLTGQPLQIKLRDTIDFTVDFTQWLAANGSPLIASATWAVAATSPKTPTIVSQAFVPSGKTNVVISNPQGALPGDTYFLEITMTTSATAPVNPTDVPIGARILVRRVNVIAVSG
jgi:hypothetical protein